MSVSVVHFDDRLAHGALRQSRKDKSYEDLDYTFTTDRFKFFTAPYRPALLDLTAVRRYFTSRPSDEATRRKASFSAARSSA